MSLVKIIQTVIVRLSGNDVDKEILLILVGRLAEDLQKQESLKHKGQMQNQKVKVIRFLRENCTLEDFQEPTPVHPFHMLYLPNTQKLVEGIMDILEG